MSGRIGFAELAKQAGQLASGDKMATIGREPLRIDILNKIAELQSRVPEQSARLRTGFVSQAEFAALRTTTQESLQAVQEALDLHAEQIEEIYEALRETEATVALHADKITELEKP